MENLLENLLETFLCSAQCEEVQSPGPLGIRTHGVVPQQIPHGYSRPQLESEVDHCLLK